MNDRINGSAAALPDMVEVPVLIGFDQNKQIGTLKIRRSELPPTPGYVFTLGVLARGVDAGPGGPYIGSYELQCVSMMDDLSYLAYLQKVGIAPAAPTPST